MKNNLKITDLKITYPGKLIPWKLNVNLFKERYPDIYLNIQDNIQEMDIYEIEDAFPETKSFDSILFSTESDCIKLSLSDETAQSIKNTDITEWYKEDCNGYMIYSENKYLYCILSICAGQAGALGIWDIQSQKWVFKHRDECFCIEALLYLDKKDVFIAYCEWFSYAGDGNCFYILKPDGSCQELEELDRCEDFDWASTSSERMRRLWSNDKYFLGYDETREVFFTIKDDVREAFFLPSAL